MASPTFASTFRRNGTLARIAGLALALAIVLILGAAGWCYLQLHAALPQVDGQVRVEGLAAPVSVLRDAQGVPHIRAANLHDLMFAQGYVAAQDRLWQMDALRRAALGELAEIVGPGAVERDRQQRLLLIRSTTERAWDALPASTREYFQAYASGVNAFIGSHRGRLPVEFRLLRYAPRAWTPNDSLALGLFLHEMLTHGHYRRQLGREKILAKLGPELTADLYPNSSLHDHPPGAEARRLDQESDDDDDDDDDDAPPVMRTTLEGAPPKPLLLGWGSSVDSEWFSAVLPGGSNDWVVSGAHTVSGKPLLSNDMHLQQAMPSLWYEAQLEITAAGASAPPFDVAGFTLPGMPFVLIGHNQRIAWGATNLGADVEDLFIETFNAQGEYQTPEGWKKPEVRHETIHVKGKPDVALDVVVTRHGPVISDFIPGETRKLALEWAPLKDPAFVRYPFFEIDSAQNWEEFRRALSAMGGPSLNFVYADVDGHIGYQAEGRIPLRTSPTNDVPVGGNDHAHEWTGVVPFDKLPSVFDPPSGIIATANARITPDKYPYPLSSEWMAPFRTERIYRVLQSGRQFAPDDMLALEMDVASEYDHFCAERFVYSVDHAKQPSARARAAADLMRSWEGQVTVDSAAPTLTVGARTELWRMLLEPKLGADYKLYRWGMQSVALENILLRQPPRWLPANYPNYDELLTAAVEAMVTSPEAPKSLNSWTWGKARPFRLEHPVLGEIPLLRRWAGPGRYQAAGDGYTVKQMGHGESHAYQQAPSERMTVDFANLDASTMNIVTGQSGQIFSPHYLDQWKAWAEGRSFVFPFSDGAVDRAKQQELRLEPGK
ncbi:MAG TPA: penicillin acylase family protein [Terriglobales bacterium]|nr:penicillin acylase family protein [Terriglobales bacterium]